MSAALELLDRVEIVEDETGIIISPIWKGVDRPNVGGWGLLRTDRPMAERLKKAIEDGAIHRDARIEKDVDGRTYVTSTEIFVLGRTMDADLKRLGY